MGEEVASAGVPDGWRQWYSALAQAGELGTDSHALVISDPEDKNFDLEAYLTKVSAES